MVRTLIIGTGSIGERHLRCLLATNRISAGICEVNGELRAKVAAQYDIPESAAFADLDAALGAKWDAAVVATPAPLHIPIATRLSRAGVHLLIEKPLATSLDGVAELVEVVKERKLVSAVAYVYRVHPALAAMKAALDAGRFGRPLQLTASCGQDFAFYRPAYRQIYYAHRASGGGAVQDALTHIFNAAEWLVGPITKIAADAAHQKLDGVEVEDTVHAIARHGPVLAGYALNQYQSPTEVVITAVCERGTARFELKECRWRWMTKADGAWEEEAFGPLERDDWFIRQEQAFLEAVEKGSRPPCTLEEGVQTLKVNLAALASADAGGGMRAVEQVTT